MQSSIVNTEKLLYLIKLYPKKTIQEIAELMTMPHIVLNNLIWSAEFRKYIEINKKTGKTTLLQEPLTTSLSEDSDIRMIISELNDAFTYLSTKEEDVEENTLTNWLVGYKPHDQIIAIDMALNEFLYTYEIKGDNNSTYKYYTLKTNKDKEWGKKDFKDQKKIKVVHK